MWLCPGSRGLQPGADKELSLQILLWGTWTFLLGGCPLSTALHRELNFHVLVHTKKTWQWIFSSRQWLFTLCWRKQSQIDEKKQFYFRWAYDNASVFSSETHPKWFSLKCCVHICWIVVFLKMLISSRNPCGSKDSCSRLWNLGKPRLKKCAWGTRASTGASRNWVQIYCFSQLCASNLENVAFLKLGAININVWQGGGVRDKPG